MPKEGSGSTANTAAIAPEVLTPPLTILRVQVRIRILEQTFFHLLFIGTVINKIVEGVDGAIAGKNGQKPHQNHFERGKRAKPQQGCKAGRRHVQQTVGGSGEGQK